MARKACVWQSISATKDSRWVRHVYLQSPYADHGYIHCIHRIQDQASPKSNGYRQKQINVLQCIQVTDLDILSYLFTLHKFPFLRLYPAIQERQDASGFYR
jgi:hypothetical protein